MTTEAKLNALLKETFPNIDLEKSTQEDLRTGLNLMLSEVERLLSLPDDYLSTPWHFLENIMDEDEKFVPGLYILKGSTLLWISEIAILLKSLLNHEKYYLGIIDSALIDKDSYDFTINNKVLARWLKQTPYRHLAAYTARMMYDEQIDWAMENNPPVQDFVAQECSGFDDAAEPDDYVQRVLTSLQEVKDHLQCGQELGLQGDEQVLTDMLWGYLPHDYPENYVGMARELNHYLQSHQPSPTLLRNEVIFENYVTPIFEKCKKLAQRHEVDFDAETINMSSSYVYYWLKDRFYEAPATEYSPSNTEEL